MKKLLSTLLLAAAVPATMLAKPYQQDSFKAHAQSMKAPIEKSLFLKADTKINPSFLMDNIGKAVFTQVIPGPGFVYYFATGCTSDANVISYEPITNSVYVVQNYSTAEYPDEPTSETRGTVNVRIYGNGGKSFTDTIQVYNKKDTIVWAPSMSILNPTGTSDPKKLNIFISNEDTRGVDVAAGLFKGFDLASFIMYNGNTTNGVPLRNTVVESGPDKSTVYYWTGLKPAGYISKESNVPYYIVGAPLDATTASGQVHGKYGMAIFQNADSQEELFSDTPTQFAISLFAPPTSTSSDNSPVLYGTDGEGTLYAMINNAFATDVTKTLPAVAKSNDDGVNWGAFDVMPWKVFDDYVQRVPDVSGTPTDELTFGFFNRQGVDFTVLGPDHFSYITTVYAQNKTNFDMYVDDIVEVYKENGHWGMRQITDLRTPRADSTRGWIDINVIFEGGSGDIDGKLAITRNPRTNEAELAVTKDKKYIIAKWIDYKHSINKDGYNVYDVYEDTVATSKLWFNNPNTDVWSEDDFQGFRSTAIYVKYKEINDTSADAWSKAKVVQLTNDKQYNIHTHISDVVPSLEQIPILTSVPYDISETSTSIYKNISVIQRGMIHGMFRNTVYYLFNALDTTSATVSVEENITSKEAVSVFPNPTTGEITVKFNASANSTVEIFNTLGEKIMDVKGNTANASGLSNGIYLVKVTNNGVVTSTLFTVAK